VKEIKEPRKEQPRAEKLSQEFKAFIADELVAGPETFVISATPAYELWRAWCARKGIEAVSQKRFGGMMAERFTKHANGGYPRYLGVRARKSPRLAVANWGPSVTEQPQASYFLRHAPPKRPIILGAM
jgi:phage/plasmid-associated DNA primase